MCSLRADVKLFSVQSNPEGSNDIILSQCSLIHEPTGVRAPSQSSGTDTDPSHGAEEPWDLLCRNTLDPAEESHDAREMGCDGDTGSGRVCPPVLRQGSEDWHRTTGGTQTPTTALPSDDGPMN
ncbi:unnamed protein product [Boreogadus saida]